MRHTAWIVFALLALSTAAAAQSGSKRLGVVNGQAITEDEERTRLEDYQRQAAAATTTIEEVMSLKDRGDDNS